MAVKNYNEYMKKISNNTSVNNTNDFKKKISNNISINNTNKTPTTSSSASLNQSTNNTTGSTTNDYYKNYINQLNTNKLNAKAEITSAQQKSNSVMQNYLRALGIAGSGAGMSAMANSNNEYANKLIQSNNNYDTQIAEAQYNQNLKNEEEKTTNEANLRADYENLISQGATTEQANEYINGNKSYYDVLNDISNSNLKADKETVLNDIASVFNNATDVSEKDSLYNLYQQIANATSNEEYQDLVSKYSNMFDNDNNYVGDTRAGVNKYENIINVEKQSFTDYDELYKYLKENGASEVILSSDGQELYIDGKRYKPIIEKNGIRIVKKD